MNLATRTPPPRPMYQHSRARLAQLAAAGRVLGINNAVMCGMKMELNMELNFESATGTVGELNKSHRD